MNEGVGWDARFPFRAHESLGFDLRVGVYFLERRIFKKGAGIFMTRLSLTRLGSSG